MHRDFHCRCWKSCLAWLGFLVLLQGKNGPEELISRVIQHPSLRILLRVGHSDFKWPVQWQLKHSEFLYLQLSGVWLVNPQWKYRFLLFSVCWRCLLGNPWRRPDERPRDHALFTRNLVYTRRWIFTVTYNSLQGAVQFPVLFLGRLQRHCFLKSEIGW